MVFFFVVLVIGVLALGPQVVLSDSSHSYTFQLSDVQQCEPVSITFVGNSSTHPILLWLTLIPFSSTPVSLPISNAPSNTSGIYVTFVPFAAGTEFIASLDDDNGESIAQLSDIVQVLPSPSGNASCLPQTDFSVITRNFSVDNSSFTQCENFTLNYNTAVISRAPSVRIFSPEGPALFLNLTSDNTTTGAATYLLAFDQSRQVVLVSDDGAGHQESSTLLTVGGNSSSSQECLLDLNDMNGLTTEVNSGSDSMPTKISMPTIIGASVGGGIIVLIIFCMLLFILRERRRRRQADLESNPVLIEKGHSSDPNDNRYTPSPTPPTPSEGVAENPLYTTEKFDARANMMSWSQPTPINQQFAGRRASTTYSVRDNEISLRSLDIERILNMASAAQADRNSTSGETVDTMPLSEESTTPFPYLTKKPSRQYVRHSSDVPFGPASMASAISMTSVVDPFAENVMKRQGQEELPTSPKNSYNISNAPPHGGQLDLPTSPRSAIRVARERKSDVSGVPQDIISEDGSAGR